MKVTRKRNDTRPISATLKRAGRAIPLDGCTIHFYMSPIEAQRGQSVSGDATIIDAAKGKVQYAFQGADVAHAGLHRAEFQVTFPDTVVETFPNGEGGDDYLYVEIIEDLG